MSYLEQQKNRLAHYHPFRLSGRVTHVIGVIIESLGPRQVFVGELAYVYGRRKEPVMCEVVGFKEDKILLMSYGSLEGIVPGSEVYPLERKHRVPVSKELLGRVLNAWGDPIDSKPLSPSDRYVLATASAPSPLDRQPITHPLTTGIRAIDSICLMGRGQRMALFSPPGVGKSTLIGTLARQTQADINVIALIGERGREVRDFIERELGPEGMAKSVVVVATADQPALLRKKGALVATAIAEYFRDQGAHVLLMMDSLSRYCAAMREIGLAVGEPPTQRGYPPSVFADLPNLLERVGCTDKGTITALYTVLTEEESFGDPIPESVRSLVDGHLILSKKRADMGLYPPIDPLKSLSRLMAHVSKKQQQKLSQKLRALFSFLEEAEEMQKLGAYTVGMHSSLDFALEKRSAIYEFLRQENEKGSSLEDTLKRMELILEGMPV